VYERVKSHAPFVCATPNTPACEFVADQITVGGQRGRVAEPPGVVLGLEMLYATVLNANAPVTLARMITLPTVISVALPLLTRVVADVDRAVHEVEPAVRVAADLRPLDHQGARAEHPDVVVITLSWCAVNVPRTHATPKSFVAAGHRHERELGIDAVDDPDRRRVRRTGDRRAGADDSTPSDRSSPRPRT